MVQGVCVFCGTAATMSREHVYGDWLSGLGLDLRPVAHRGGWLNREGLDYGTRPPFRHTVRDVCEPCNSGWLSRLEETAKRTVGPFILGTPGAIKDAADLGAVAAWAHKTALVAMLVSGEEERSHWYGLPPGEYRGLYERRAERVPLPASRFWLGRYEPGCRHASTRVTPVVVSRGGVDRSEIADGPDGYLMTLIIGELLIHGIRFTAPRVHLRATPALDLVPLWPASVPVIWPCGEPLTDDGYFPFVDGRTLRSDEPDSMINRWTPATDLTRSEVTGSAVRLPLACGQQVTFYPLRLVDVAMAGRFHAFATGCECGKAYLVRTAPDGARCTAIGTPEGILERYEALDGEEIEIHDDNGIFICKQLPGGHQ